MAVTTPARARFMVTEVIEGVTATRVLGRCLGEPVEVDVEHAADVSAAQRFAGSMRRVDLVEICFGADGLAHCFVQGVGHRQPVHRRISVELGLGLAAIGAPALVGGEP